MQAPLELMQLPWTNACKPVEENRPAASAQLWPVRNIWKGPALWPVRPVHNRAQKWLKTTWKLSKCIQ
jgi:hypothetical protein